MSPAAVVSFYNEYFRSAKFFLAQKIVVLPVRERVAHGKFNWAAFGK
jgi:hypothetical protein